MDSIIINSKYEIGLNYSEGSKSWEWFIVNIKEDDVVEWGIRYETKKDALEDAIKVIKKLN